MLDRLKTRLIDDWRRALGLWSVRLHLAVLAFTAVYELSPVFPAEIAALFPAHLRTPIIGLYAIAGIGLRLIKQKTNAAG